MSKIIVGVDQSEGSGDAIALASSLAGITGAELLLANVFDYDAVPSRAINEALETQLRDGSQALLERARGELDVVAEVRSVANPSPAHGLHDLAEQEDASLIVVGSSHTGRAGRVLPGSTGERLLHGAPCPVAVAPKGYRQRVGGEHGTVGVAYDGSRSAQSALQAGRGIAEATGARLRLIRAFQPRTYNYPPATSYAVNTIGSYNDSLQERAAREVEAAAAGIEGEPKADACFAIGDPARILIEATERLDMLFVGSRGYGPLHSVLVGGVAGRVVREAACPVIVLPRQAGHIEEDSLFAEATSLHR
jgi:nucleotide-binding universal stress UspA family protein